MAKLQEKMAQVIAPAREEIRSLVKEHGDKVVSQVTVKQMYGGMRGVKGLNCDTSLVPPDKGLIIRGIPLADLFEKLPEEVYYLLLTGDLPNAEELADLQAEFKANQNVPTYVWDVLNAMPKDSHPMAMFDTAILVMQRESIFAKRYNEGLKKDMYWDATLADAIALVAKLPEIAAWIYRKRFDKGDPIASNPDLDWGANYVHMLGLDDPNGEFTKLMRLYLVLHTDHEGGNVSAFSAATVNSALSDLYYSLSAGLNGLAGPLHGLANQECLKWVLEVNEKFGGSPSEEDLEKFAWDTLNAGKVVPGYGHAVLRVTDPRFTAFHAFGQKYCADDEVFKTVARVFKVVPKVLGQIEKISNPWPNVDAGSGALLYRYGMKEFSYYTVLFSVSRAMGITAQAVVARAMGYPITRPKSVQTDWVKEQVTK